MLCGVASNSVRTLSALAVLCVLLLPAVSAQGPDQEPIAIDASPTDVDVTFADPAIVTLIVSRPGVTGSPADDPVGQLFDPLASAEVDVSASGLTTGWLVALDPSGFSLAPGESREVQATISVTTDADAEERLDITFTATMTSPDPSGVFVPSGQASTTVTATHDETATRDLIEAIGPGIWAILGALLVSIIVAVFLIVDSRTKVVQMGTPASEIHLTAGESADIPFWIENRARDTDRFNLSTNAGDPAWQGRLATTGVTLQAGEKQELEFTIKAAKDAKEGSRNVVRVIAVPDHAPRRISVLAVTVKVTK